MKSIFVDKQNYSHMSTVCQELKYSPLIWEETDYNEVEEEECHANMALLSVILKRSYCTSF